MHLRVSLLTPLAGKLGPVSLSKNGRFIFDDVKLLEDEPSSFSLQVDDEGGRTLLTHEFKVRYAPDDVEINTFINSLPHPLYLRVAGGMKLIADEGVDLPAKCEVTVSKLRAESELKLRIYLKEDEVGFILIENIPEEAGEGCPVMLDLEITERGVLKGIASVLNRNDTVVAQSEVRIKFPPIALPTLPELRNQFDTLEDKRQQELDLSAIPERRTLLGGKGQKLANRIKKLFGEQEPDKQELAREIREMDRLINPPRDDMDPPRAYFMGLLETCMNLMDAKGSDPEVQPLRSMWDRINEDGREAYMTRNHKRWTTVYESLRLLYDRLSKLGKKENGDNDEIPPTEMSKDAGHQVVEGLRALLATERMKHESLPEYATRIRPRVDEIEKALGEIDAKIHKIKSELPPKQGQAQVQLSLLPARKLEKDIGLLTEEIEDRKGAYSNGYRN